MAAISLGGLDGLLGQVVCFFCQAFRSGPLVAEPGHYTRKHPDFQPPTTEGQLRRSGSLLKSFLEMPM
jgi:hypothetical protein